MIRCPRINFEKTQLLEWEIYLVVGGWMKSDAGQKKKKKC